MKRVRIVPFLIAAMFLGGLASRGAAIVGAINQTEKTPPEWGRLSFPAHHRLLRGHNYSNLWMVRGPL
jgi:hypothetical protein